MDFNKLKLQLEQGQLPLFNNKFNEELKAAQQCAHAEKDYFAYYGIDLENQLPNVRHKFGSLESCKYQIACPPVRTEKTLKEHFLSCMVITIMSGYLAISLRFY